MDYAHYLPDDTVGSVYARKKKRLDLELKIQESKDKRVSEYFISDWETIATIAIQSAAAAFGVKWRELTGGKCKKTPVLVARYVAILKTKQYTAYGKNRLANMFGYKNATSVDSAICQLTSIYEKHEIYGAKVEKAHALFAERLENYRAMQKSA